MDVQQLIDQLEAFAAQNEADMLAAAQANTPLEGLDLASIRIKYHGMSALLLRYIKSAATGHATPSAAIQAIMQALSTLLLAAMQEKLNPDKLVAADLPANPNLPVIDFTEEEVIIFVVSALNGLGLLVAAVIDGEGGD